MASEAWIESRAEAVADSGCSHAVAVDEGVGCPAAASAASAAAVAACALP